MLIDAQADLELTGNVADLTDLLALIKSSSPDLVLLDWDVLGNRIETLQTLLELPIPRYHHHPLIRDENGKRLAKRDDARALSKYRAEGASPNDIRRLVDLPQV